MRNHVENKKETTMKKNNMILGMEKYYKTQIASQPRYLLETGYAIACAGAEATSETDYIFYSSEDINHWIENEYIDEHATDFGLSIEEAKKAYNLYKNYSEWLDNYRQLQAMFAVEHDIT